MALDLLRDCTFFGPALPEPFVKFELEKHLRERQLLPRADGAEGRALQERWEVYRRKLRALGEQGGDLRVASHVLAPLTERLGYASFERQTEVGTREGLEDGGWLMRGEGSTLRCWSVELGTDLDAPNLRGRAYRFSPARVAQRVLLAQGERVGLLTDGEELRILLCDPARPDSHIAIRLDQSNGWRAPSEAPDSYRLLLALASPSGTKAISDLTEAARLAQATVTRKLRVQARRAIEDFIQSVLDQPANVPVRATTDTDELAKNLWREGLVLVYRLLFIFKLESSADPARAFSFAATSLWRNTYSPNVALASLVRKVLDDGAETGGLLEEGLRVLWRMFAHGLSSRELQVSALGGMLFGEGSTPLLDRLQWGETAVAKLLDALLWTPSQGRVERERVHYGALDVEDLGRVYEALLELEPGVATEPMCRLRRAKLEVVVPAVQGEAYRANSAADVTPDEDESDSDEEAEEEEEIAFPRKHSNAGGKTKVQFIESIQAGRFYLRVGLGRKASGSYYTPHPFVRFLVQETLGPQIEDRSPHVDPQPSRILGLKVLDPAMGSGHFLVEACRFLGEALYEACRLCDELALQAEGQAERVSDTGERERLLRHARDLRERVEALPDPNNELVAYLPSRVLEGQESGPSQRKAHALCRRLVAVHCLYGVDKNPLAVELAKLSLWLESYAEGLPLTFLDHRLIGGDSLTGPFSEHLSTYPRSQKEIRGLFVHGLTTRLEEVLASALAYVRDLEASVGKDLPDLARKHKASELLASALHPLRLLAAAWSGGVMLGADADDDAYLELVQAVVERHDIQCILENKPKLASMVKSGAGGVCYDLTFPEIFHPAGNLERVGGFHAVLGNPPWDTITIKKKEWFAGVNFSYLDTSPQERAQLEQEIFAVEKRKADFDLYTKRFEFRKRLNDALFSFQKVKIDGDLAGRFLDEFRVFMERNAQLLAPEGLTGVVVPSAFHSNEGATGVRQLYLNHLALRYCFSFENRKKIFDIHSSFKFAAVVAAKGGATKEFACGFYLHDLDWLFSPRRDALIFTRDFILSFDPKYLSFLELADLRSTAVMAAARTASNLGNWREAHSVNFTTSELNLTKDAWRLAGLGDDFYKTRGFDEKIRWSIDSCTFPVFEGKSVHQFQDSHEGGPSLGVAWANLVDRPHWFEAVRYFRLGYRKIARSTDERTSIWAMLPPLSITAESFPSEKGIPQRSNAEALILLGVMNSFVAEFFLRQRVTANVNLFILDSTPLPKIKDAGRRLLAHAALRLTANHDGYAALWYDQVGDLWRESGRPAFIWPVLLQESARWGLRAAMDAVVANAYGLSREQYAHVLSTFSHKAYPEALNLCLAASDELEVLGLDAFSRKYDPYSDIGLNQDLAKPAVDLPQLNGSDPAVEEDGQLLLLAGEDSLGASASCQKPEQGHSRDIFGLVSALLETRGEITSRHAQDLTGLDANAVRPYLERLVEEGLAVKEGQRRGTKYRKAEPDV